MAFYAYDATRQAIQSIGSNDRLRSDGVGAYYAYDATHEAVQPINGLALGSSAELADEALRNIVGRRRPVMVAREWAARVTDVRWKAPSGTDDLTLLAVTDQELARVKSSAFGHDLPIIAVLSQESPTIAQSEGAFVGTPYAFTEQIAVAHVADGRAVPVPLFLTMAHLRDADDPDGGSSTLLQTAQALGGQLVYPIALPVTAARRPLPPLQRALRLVPRAPAQQTVPGVPPPPATPNRVSLSGPHRTGFRRGMLGDVSTPTVLTIVGVVALAGVVVAAAAMGGSKGT